MPHGTDVPDICAECSEQVYLDSAREYVKMHKEFKTWWQETYAVGLQHAPLGMEDIFKAMCKVAWNAGYRANKKFEETTPPSNRHIDI